jgi:hypothetical protein
VVAHRGGVALDAVQLPALDQLETGDARNPGGSRGGGERQRQARALGRAELWRLPLVDDGERRVEIVDRQRAVDVGASEAELSGSAQQVCERRRLAHEEGRAVGLGRRDRSAVPEAHMKRPRWERARKGPAQWRASARQLHAPHDSERRLPLEGRAAGVAEGLVALAHGVAKAVLGGAALEGVAL